MFLGELSVNLFLAKKAFLLLGILLFTLIVFLWWASGKILAPGVYSGEIVQYGPGHNTEDIPPTSLKVMSWNIAYAQGKGSEGGADYNPRSPQEMDRRIREMGKVIRDSGADVVLIQEIDFKAGRSHHRNQLKLLALASGLNYGAKAVSWDVNYLPFPYWPIKNHFGRVVSGGAILSRFPIVKNEMKLLKKPESYGFFYNLFYIGRFSQQVEVQVGGERYSLFNSHLEAFDMPNRVEQATELVKWMHDLQGKVAPILAFGGDLNTVPVASVKKDFGPNDTYVGDVTHQVLQNLPSLAEESDGLDHQNFTYPAHRPDRKLDYIFVEPKRLVQAKILGTVELSDHLPVLAEILL